MSRLASFVALLVVSTASLVGQTDWEKTRSIAEAQHEIVMLAIKNKQYDKVLPNSKKIFALTFPTNREHLLVDHAKLSSSLLVEQANYPLAHQIVDEAIKVVRNNKSKAALLKEKAVICSREGHDGDAMKFFEEAVKLEEAKP